MTCHSPFDACRWSEIAAEFDGLTIASPIPGFHLLRGMPASSPFAALQGPNKAIAGATVLSKNLRQGYRLKSLERLR